MRIEYDFLRVGSFVEPRPGYIYIDIGNQSVPGVIDTHPEVIDNDRFVCSSSLIVDQPSLVTDWIAGEDLRRPVHLVMHEHPDYDCIASAFLVRRLLEARARGDAFPTGWEEWAPVVAESAKRIDRGETRLQLPIKDGSTALTPYFSMIALHDQIVRDARTPRESWARMIEQGQEILGRAIRVARESGTTDLNVVDLRGSLSDLGDLEEIIDRKVEAFARDAARVGLHSLQPGDGGLDGLYEIRLPLRYQTSGVMTSRIVCILDPEAGGGFFKSVIRGAYRETIQATCIFETVEPDHAAGTEKWVRAIISVDPDSPFDLRGLGRYLDDLETKRREVLRQPRVGKPRPGFDNSDPWYDGRGFGYTIVDSPRWGTVLTADQLLLAVRNSNRWIAIRVGDVIGECLESVRGATADTHVRHGTFTAILHAIDEWQSLEERHPLHRECVDVLATIADPEDLEREERLLRSLPEVLLGLLRNDDARVREAALAIGARGMRLEPYARESARRDVVSLIRIVSSDVPSAVARAVGEGAEEAGDELLFDAVAARIRTRNRIEESVMTSAATLAGRVADRPRTRASIANLHREAQAQGATADLLTPFLRASLEADPATGTLDDVRRLIREHQAAVAAHLLAALLRDPQSDVAGGKRAVLEITSALLEELQTIGADEEIATDAGVIMMSIGELLSTEETLCSLTPRAAAAAMRISPEFVGRVLRAMPQSAAARWTMISAALNGGWESALAAARSFVLDPSDAISYRLAEALTRVATGSELSTASACGSQRVAFLLLAAARSRDAAVPESVHGAVTKVLGLSDLAKNPFELGVLRRVITQELRHAAPDHFLLADAEASLAKAEMFASIIALAGEQESTAGKAIIGVLRIAASLPEIQWDAVEELMELRRSPWPATSGELEKLGELVLACAHAVDGIRDGRVLVTEVERLREVARFIESRLSACLDSVVGRAVAIALRDVQMVLEDHARVLHSAQTEENQEQIEALSLRMLEASTIARFVTDWRAFENPADADRSVRMTTRLTRIRDAAEARRCYSEVRAELGRRKPPQESYRRAEHALARRVDGREGSAGTVDAKYERMRELLALPAESLDRAYAQLVDALIKRYDIHRARRCIDDYTFGRLPVFLQFFMSGWTVVIPAAFIALFIVQPANDYGLLDLALYALTAIICIVGALQWNHRRLSTGPPTVESLRYRLFLPQYVVPVLVGVYTVALIHEVAAHLALQLEDGRYLAFTVGFFVAAAMALGQLIRRDGGKPAPLNVLITAARLFAYAFVVALFLNVMVFPLVEFEEGLHEKRREWIGQSHGKVHLALPLKTTTRISELTLYPRHIVLDALFGMFAAIVVKEFLKAGESE